MRKRPLNFFVCRAPVKRAASFWLFNGPEVAYPHQRKQFINYIKCYFTGWMVFGKPQDWRNISAELKLVTHKANLSIGSYRDAIFIYKGYSKGFAEKSEFSKFLTLNLTFNFENYV